MLSDSNFLTAFENQTYPLEKFHHREHIRLAYLLLNECSFDESLARIRSGIKAFNHANGVIDQPTSGYHETMTVAWLRLVEMILSEYGPEPTSDAFCDAHPELLEKKSLRLFYSRDCMGSPEAKMNFVKADLTPLPRARNAPRRR